ncbi:interactor of HORMAD1 protein 1 [Dicentrarchus labrax]|uniref:Interactor of HORMAD1 protein 1 n=1 Tax=Dicentrarchus labrax TaxID=13489 RepID=A0A8C4I2R7_DICLA|nr:interactor of HORMAD1 protein 1 [Dicentrarchus labrax]XP_051270233.1 interactor of HORMAD1 protein 1 [Dicentrarchus labrax]
MNHIRSIKEMLSIPTGRNVSTSGYSSYTDSQLFFGSQFWPENSQGASQDMSVSSRTSLSQQSSQEGSDPKFSNSYHTKPLLFGELKDKNKAFGILDKFEEDKKRAKEKTDSDILAKECHNFRETLNNIQQLVAGTEKNTTVCQTVLEKFDNFASTLQNNLKSLQSDISQQFETLLNKVNSQTGMMTELEERMQKSGTASPELGSNLQSLKNSLECLREEQERERNMLEEALKLLSTLVSTKTSPERVMDSAIQTSPRLEQPFSDIVQDNKLEGTQLTCMSYNTEHNQAQVPPQNPSCITGKRKSTLKGNRRRKRRPLVLSQRRMRTDTDENSQPLMHCNKQQNVSSPLGEWRDPNAVASQDSRNPDCLILPKRETRSIAAGCFITPFSCWSQDSNSSVCLSGIEPILEKLSESKTGTQVKQEGFWQLFEMDSDLGL